VPLQVRQDRNGLRFSENEYKTTNSPPVTASEPSKLLVSSSETTKASTNTDKRMMATPP